MSPEHSNPRAELEERLRFETLIADPSAKFVSLTAGEVDREIMDAERRICEALDLDISAIWQWSTGPLRVASRSPLTPFPREWLNQPQDS